MAVLSEADRAWASGWAMVDDPDTGYVQPTWAHLVAGTAAVEVAPHHLAWVAETAERTATRLALHRARLRLYDQHAKIIVGILAPALQQIDAKHLVTSMFLAGDDRNSRRDQAHAAIVNAAIPARPRLDAANQQAWHAATNRGHAEAAATPTTGGPPDPRKVAALLATGVVIGGVGPHGAEWTDRQLGRVAWNISAATNLTGDTPDQTVADILDDPTDAGDALGDSMHGAMTGAFTDYFATGDGTGLGQLAWVTEGDDRVCPACDDLEANGPYDPLDFPDQPAHPLCRCSQELA